MTLEGALKETMELMEALEKKLVCRKTKYSGYNIF